ncbi:MAG: helix-turn-helix transcriptional regulator [Nocardioidaceae bacterium]
MAPGRRGRPYQVPEDTTSLRAASVNVDARVGWLLLMSRLHHHDPDLALGEQFNAALRRVGLQADRSAVSRWESGKVTPRYSVLVAYEQALGLRAGQLTSVVNALRRALGGEGLPAWMPILDSRSEGFHERLDSLF